MPSDDQWPVYRGAVSSTSGANVLMIQEGFGADASTRSRAVLLDSRSGRVVRVVALPLPDRNMDSVSGGAAGVAYRTVGSGGDTRTYWEYPDEEQGQLLAGVPADVTTVVAQP